MTLIWRCTRFMFDILDEYLTMRLENNWFQFIITEKGNKELFLIAFREEQKTLFTGTDFI